MEVQDDEINPPDVIDSAPASPSISSETSISDTDSESCQNNVNCDVYSDSAVTSNNPHADFSLSTNNNNDSRHPFHIEGSGDLKDHDDSENEGSDLNDKGGIDFPVACASGENSFEMREPLETAPPGGIQRTATNWPDESGSDVESDVSNLVEPGGGCESNLRGISDEPVSRYESNSNISDSPDDLDADHDIYDGNFNEAECLQNRLNQQAVSSLEFFENSGESSNDGLNQVADAGYSPGRDSMNSNNRTLLESLPAREYNESEHLSGEVPIPNYSGSAHGRRSPRSGSVSHVQSSSEVACIGDNVDNSGERDVSPNIDSQCDSRFPSSNTHKSHQNTSESSNINSISQSDSISKCHRHTVGNQDEVPQTFSDQNSDENVVSSSNCQHNVEGHHSTFPSSNMDHTEPISDNEMSDEMEDDEKTCEVSSKDKFKNNDLSDVSDDDNLDIEMEENDDKYNKYDLGRDDSDQEKKHGKTNSQKSDSVKVKAHSSFSEDHVELDYDEEVHEEVPAQGQDNQLEEGEEDIEEGEERDSDKDEGELDDDDDCEEGEIREPGSRKPNGPPICRFYARGHCTWGAICRFIHPGINDKGNYRLLDDQPAFNGRGRVDIPVPFDQERWEPKVVRNSKPEADLPPPPELPPPSETAWERGLRHAKEMMKKSAQRKEQEPDFEEKRFNLSVEEDAKEMNKENERMSKYYRDPYYDGDLYDDEYYDKTPGWNGGQYENFEVRNVFNKSPDFPEREPAKEKLRERHFSPIEKVERRDEKWREKLNNEVAIPKVKADEWHDPWQRSKSPKQKKRGSRSGSRGRKKRKRSDSYSSYSSSSSSSYSRSDSDSSLSRSPTPPPPRRPIQAPLNRRPQMPPKLSEPPKSAVTVKPRIRSPIKRKMPIHPIPQPPERGRLPPERGRHPLRGMPKNSGRIPGKFPPSTRHRSRSSSVSSGSRSHSSSSFSRSRSRSASSFSSGSSSFSSSSSGSADSDNLYRDLPSPASSASSRSPTLKKPGRAKHRHLRNKNLHKERPGIGRRKTGLDPKMKNRSAPLGRPPPLTPTKSTKDPLKLSGQKQNIKLTLLNKQPTDKSISNVTKKRPAEPPTMAPPAKKSTSVMEPVKEKIVKSSKPQRLPSPKQKLPSPVKVPSKPLGTSQLTVKQTQGAKTAPAATNQQPAANATTKVKKSMSSRREELLKQLKAVEDAIAKKRSKP